MEDATQCPPTTGRGVTCTWESGQRGRHFKFPAGTFNVSYQVYVPANTVIEGAGTPNDMSDPEKKPREVNNCNPCAMPTRNPCAMRGEWDVRPGVNGTEGRKQPPGTDAPLPLGSTGGGRPGGLRTALLIVLTSVFLTSTLPLLQAEQTFFVVDARAGLKDGRPYCKQVSAATAKQLRPGFLLSSNTTVRNINFQGADLRRGSDNGDLCGGGVFETPGCVRGEDCAASTGDGKAVQNVRIQNVRLHDLYYDEQTFKANPTHMPASQVALWVPVTKDGAQSENISVTGLVSMYVTFQLTFHRFDRFELDLYAGIYMCGARPSPALKIGRYYCADLTF